MKLKNGSINVEEAIDFSSSGNIILKRRENRLLLSDYQISVLEMNDINYLNYSNVRSLLFDIEEILTTDYDEELDNVANELAELVYYGHEYYFWPSLVKNTGAQTIARYCFSRRFRRFAVLP